MSTKREVSETTMEFAPPASLNPQAWHEDNPQWDYTLFMHTKDPGNAMRYDRYLREGYQVDDTYPHNIAGVQTMLRVPKGFKEQRARDYAMYLRSLGANPENPEAEERRGDPLSLSGLGDGLPEQANAPKGFGPRSE